jgi:exonuclease III
LKEKTTASSSTRPAEGTRRGASEGWFDCIWEKCGEEMQTWFRAGDRPYQLDHAFCDPALGDRLQTVWVATEAAANLGLSDHAPLILDFEVAPISMTGLTEQADRLT